MTCIEHWCRKPARDAETDYCSYHADVHQIETMLAKEERQRDTYLWSQLCLSCGLRADVTLTTTTRDNLVKSGWLRCPSCRCRAIELTKFELGSMTSRLDNVHHVTRSQGFSLKLAG